MKCLSDRLSALLRSCEKDNVYSHIRLPYLLIEDKLSQALQPIYAVSLNESSALRTS